MTHTSSHAHQRMIDKLQRQFNGQLFRHAGATYPVTALLAPADQQDIDSVLAPHVPADYSDPAAFPIYHHAHLEARKKTRHMSNGLVYVLDQLETAPLRMSARLGHYFDMMATCDALDHELRDYSLGKREDTPLRDRFFAHVAPEQMLLNGRGRSAVIGVAMLTAYQHDGRYYGLLVQRAGNLATGAGLFHLMPAFVLQPSGPAHLFAGEWSVRHQCLREFGEELFGMPEFDGWPGADDARYFYDFAPVAELRAMLEDGRAEMKLTGVVTNLLSTRPEICGYLLIHDEGWLPRWHDALLAAQMTERQATFHIPLDTLEGLPDGLHVRMVPQGAAALWLALDRLRARGVI